MNAENTDLLRTVAAMEFDPLPIADAIMIGELVNSGKLQQRIYSVGETMRLSAYLITLQKADLVRAMEETALDAIGARDQMQLQAEWLRTVANILDSAAGRLAVAAAAFATEPDEGDDDPGPMAA